MDSKLTLKLDREVIEKAKRYAKRQGVSLSQLVESYLRRLAEAEEPLQKERTGIAAELAGLFAGVEIGDAKEEYVDYLIKKYS